MKTIEGQPSGMTAKHSTRSKELGLHPDASICSTVGLERRLLSSCLAAASVGPGASKGLSDSGVLVTAGGGSGLLGFTPPSALASPLATAPHAMEDRFFLDTNKHSAKGEFALLK